ncbi:cytochrome P450 [Mycena galericulata]|nr:cytochrome P450 [Mycena galericulata]
MTIISAAMIDASWMWALSLGVGLVLYYGLSCPTRAKLPLPPGPRKLPLLGNLFNIPSRRPWEAYMAWSKLYKSDIIHVDIAGTSVVVLSSLEAVETLLERRSAIYSDRQAARAPMLVELMGWDFVTGLMKYGDEWRTHRRLLKQEFTPKGIVKHRPSQLAAAHGVLRGFLSAPESFMIHLRRSAAETILSAVYGIDIQPSDDTYIALACEALESLSAAGVPGKYLVDSLPMLKHIPAWLPGARFKRDAKEWRKLAAAMRDVPFAETKRQMESGTAPPSFVGDSLTALKECEEDHYTETTVRDTAGSLFVGGAETTVSVVSTFLLAMLANPDAQRVAQAEVDSITGGNHLPDFEDSDDESMPYVAALVKEVMRWRNVGPIAVPHFIGVEDEYRGWRIPAGSIVIGNSWAITHDEVTYPDPYTFKPERFLLNGKLNPDVQDPERIAFGFGRRQCPGLHFARDAIWITIVSILATFDIAKALDEDGREMELSYEFDSRFISLPLPFRCSIRPRSEEAKALIRATAGV